MLRCSRQQTLVAQFSQVVRDQVLRLLKDLDQLLDVHIGSSEPLEQLPADSIGEQLQEAEGIGKWVSGSHYLLQMELYQI